MWSENKDGILLSGIPVKRKRPDTQHIEYDDDQYARVDFDKESGTIDALHTPEEPFLRVHEMMHTHHTDPKVVSEAYEGIRDIVWNITEDARIHINHWPWQYYDTPTAIKDSALALMRKERAETAKVLKKDPTKAGSWPDFATRLRQAAIYTGLGMSQRSAVKKVKFADDNQVDFALHILWLLACDEPRKAALELQAAFFPPLPVKQGNDDGRRSGIKIKGADGEIHQPKMKIVVLPLSEQIPEAKRGYRRATSGSRLHRPSLRKPVIPQRLFLRQTPREAAGTILVDASGSMGDFDEIIKWMQAAPFGQIAYYSGGSRWGELVIAAKNGKRAREFPSPHGGNTVDGPAIDWLMSQPKPRVMITDRGFCGAKDSVAQIVRLANLERQGEIKVFDYAHDR